MTAAEFRMINVVDFDTEPTNTTDDEWYEMMSDNIFIQGAWHIAVIYAPNAESYREVRRAMAADNIKTAFLFQRRLDVIIIHRCFLHAPHACKCVAIKNCVGYKPSVKQGRQVLNVLRDTSPISLFDQMFTALIYASEYEYADDRIHNCFKGMIKGKIMPIGDALIAKLKSLRERCSGTPYSTDDIKSFSLVGHHVAHFVHGVCKTTGTTVSTIQESQAKRLKKSEEFSYLDILKGVNVKNPKEIDILIKGPSQIAQGVDRILDTIRPMPLERLVRTDDWLGSVYANLPVSSPYVIEGIALFRERMLRMSLVEYLAELSQRNPYRLIFSASQSKVYMPIDASFDFLQEWIEFQFEEKATSFVVDVFSWLSRGEIKKLGLYIQGPSNSGKSYVFLALIGLFISVGSFKPSEGYEFNYCDLPNRQVILAEEFHLPKKDQTLIETLKELLCGNDVRVRMKNTKPETVYPTPFLFISNLTPFDMDEEEEGANPWPSRLFAYHTKVYTDRFQAINRSQCLHPFAWIRLFQKYKLMD